MDWDGLELVMVSNPYCAKPRHAARLIMFIYLLPEVLGMLCMPMSFTASHTLSDVATYQCAQHCPHYLTSFCCTEAVLTF